MNKRKLIFWQNIISHLQSYSLVELAKYYNVTLVVEEFLSQDRERQGWIVPDLPGVEIISIKNINNVADYVLSNLDSLHFFSGFSGMGSFQIQKAFKEIIKYKKVCIIAESPIQMGLKTTFRRLLYKAYYLRYGKKIERIFAMGDIGVQWYRNAGFSSQTVIPFQYILDSPPYRIPERSYSINTRFVFIGQLIDRKGLDILLNAFRLLKRTTDWSFDIIGSGKELDSLKSLVVKNNLTNSVSFQGNLDNQEAKRYLLTKADYLILPSRFDGWGAVVNEALSVGVKAIVSNKCGSSKLILSDEYGYTYQFDDINLLANVLLEAIENKVYSASELGRKYKENYTNKLVEQFVSEINSLEDASKI